MNKQVLVTGAANGLGWAIANRFHQLGYGVIAWDLLNNNPSEFQIQVCDVASAENVHKMASEIPCPDIIVHAAGITRDKVSWKMTDEDWNRVLQVNLYGAFHLVSAFSAKMKERQSGNIIMISSINAQRGKFGQLNYVASKAGLEAMVKNLAIELGQYQIRVNAVAPGMVISEMTKKLAPEILAKAENERLLPYPPLANDIADAVLFLAEERSRCITGQILKVDSGQSVG